MSRTTAALALAIALSSVLACEHRPITAEFRYEEGACSLSPGDSAKLGGSLTDRELTSIEALSRTELDRAFDGLRIAISDRHDAFWHVVVRQTLSNGQNFLPKSGGSLSLGFLGGTGQVGCDVVIAEAIHHAPPGATREVILEGIGRGIGRVAAHEFAHQIVGAQMMHNEADVDSYEHPSPDRASQYYGELHWTTAWPLLRDRLGK